MKKEVTLYSSILFPFWFLILLPNTWLFVIATNFIFVSIVLIGALKQIGIDEISSVWKKSIFWNTLYGFLAYLVSAALLVPTQFVSENSKFGSWVLKHVTDQIAANPFSNVYTILYTLTAVAIGGLIVYFGNKKFAFKKTMLNETGTKKVSLYLALFSAPYFVFFPSEIFYHSVTALIHLM